MNWSMLLLIGIGLLLLVGGVISQLNHHKKKTSGEFKEILGTIVDYKREMDRDSDGVSYSYYPIIEYFVDGQTYRYTSNHGGGSRRGIGKQKKIMYNINNPSDAINSKDSTGAILAVIGLIIIVAGVYKMIAG